MSDHHIQLVMLIVQALALAGLSLYCVETYKLRKATRRLVQTSMEQVEGLSKPCVTFWAELLTARTGFWATAEQAHKAFRAMPEMGSSHSN